MERGIFVHILLGNNGLDHVFLQVLTHDFQIHAFLVLRRYDDRMHADRSQQPIDVVVFARDLSGQK